MEKNIISILLLGSYFPTLISATSDPNVYRKNQTEADDFEDPSKFISVNLIDQLTKSRLNEKLNKFYLKKMASLSSVNFLENEILDKRYNRKLIESDEMFEGDIRDVDSMDEMRNAVIDPRLRWPKATIPYVISTNFNEKERNVIAQAMLEYHRGTCIRFIPRSNQADYIVFRTTGSGCNSNVGRTGGPQTVSLDTGCVHIGIVIHELMHAAGFFHEQSRTDRDDYVIINWDNIPEANRRNFDKFSQKEIQNLGVAYDTGSVMHYDKFAFAKNPNVPTIISRSGSKLGNSDGFSKTDLIKLNRLYQCELPTPTTTALPQTQSTPRQTTTMTSAMTTSTRIPSTTTEAITTSQTSDPKECSDSGAGCILFRDQGFCTKTVELMKIFCKKTCGLCSEPEVICLDGDERCGFWAEKGECNANPNFMLKTCQMSCGVCKVV